MPTAAKYVGAFAGSILASFLLVVAVSFGVNAATAEANDSPDLADNPGIENPTDGTTEGTGEGAGDGTGEGTGDGTDQGNPATEPVVEPEPSYEVNLVAVGDNLIHTAIYNAAKQPDGTYNFDSLYENVLDDIQNADLASINQESIFRPNSKISGYPKFGTPYAVGRAQAKAGFDIVQHANNHVMDKGLTPIQNTIDWWHENYPSMKVIGIHSSKSCASTIHMIKKNGIKIALLSYTYATKAMKNRYVPKSKKYLVDILSPANKTKIANDIKRAKKNADFVIVYAHMGTEYTYKASAETYGWAKWFSNRGVDLLIGTHPHVVQPVKYVYSSSKKHKMLCYYSLGNFVSKSTRLPNVNSLLGGMAKVKITKSSPTAKAKIASYKFVPLVTQKGKTGEYGFTVYKLADYTTELAKANGFHKEYGSKVSVKYFKDRWTKITGRKIQS